MTGFVCRYPVEPEIPEAEPIPHLRYFDRSNPDFAALSEPDPALTAHAIRLARHAIACFPRRKAGYARLAQLAFERGDSDLALEAYGQMFARFPGSNQARLNLTFVHLHRSDYDEAEAVFTTPHDRFEPRALPTAIYIRLLSAFLASKSFPGLTEDFHARFFLTPHLERLLAGSLSRVLNAFSLTQHQDYARLAHNVCRERGADFLYVSMDSVFSLSNPSAHERDLFEISMRLHARSFNRVEWLKSEPAHVVEAFREVSGYSPDYLAQILGAPDIEPRLSGLRLGDWRSDYLNVRDGRRITSDAPDDAEHTVWVFGASDAFGFGCEDSHTIASRLQALFNQREYRGGGAAAPRYRLENHGLRGAPMAACVNNLRHAAIRPGDKVVLLGFPALSAGSGVAALNVNLDRPHEHGEIFLDPTHLNHRGAAIVAERLYDALQSGHFSPRTWPVPDRAEASLNLLKYLLYRTYSDQYERDELAAARTRFQAAARLDIAGRIGSVSVNCDPMTLGHLALLEHAAGQVDHLYVLVIEDDYSHFDFADRFAMVQAGLAHLGNVSVLPGGRYVCTRLTFPEYADKAGSDGSAADASADAWYFAEHIAPILGISTIFLGEEPHCAVTRRYNEQMIDILPRFGIAVEIMPRIENGGRPISASAVRRHLAAGEWEALSALVPDSTAAHLRRLSDLAGEAAFLDSEPAEA